MNQPKIERRLRELEAIGAQVEQRGCLYVIRARGECIQTTDLASLGEHDLALLAGKEPTRDRIYSKHARQ